ncbi:MAG: glycosyltransferase, partial [Candidatus Promineifilaceae bacterium]
EDEAQAVRDLGLKSPVAIIPNGVNVPEQAATPQRAPNHKRRILFLSRIHPKKGLINLVRAAAQLPKDVDWEIVIAGPSEDGYQQVVEAEVAALGLQDRFVFLGMVADQDKWAVYKSADLFILPTHNENFGIVVAEALASGIPAITTKGAPWQELEQHRCGWWVDITVDALATALQQSLSLSNQELAEMGARGRNLIINQYSWQHIATKMTQAYEWVLGQQTTLPDCIHLA